LAADLTLLGLPVPHRTGPDLIRVALVDHRELTSNCHIS
jgi:hypothetical protein